MKKILIMLCILGLAVNAYSADEWSKDEPSGGKTVSDIDYYIGINNEALDRLQGDHQNIVLVYSSATQITASAGSVACSNSTGTVRKMRLNTAATTVTWADIDAGAEAGSTTYYVYANCDADATTATFKISINSSTPTGLTYYKKIGSFYNDASSNIDRTKVYTNAYAPQPTDSSGIPSVTAIYDYGTSSSSYTAKGSDLKFAFGQASVGANSTVTISNLPYTSTSTFKCWASFDQDLTNDDGYAGCTPASASTLTIINQQGAGTRTIQWGAVGY